MSTSIRIDFPYTHETGKVKITHAGSKPNTPKTGKEIPPNTFFWGAVGNGPIGLYYKEGGQVHSFVDQNGRVDINTWSYDVPVVQYEAHEIEIVLHPLKPSTTQKELRHT